MKYCEICGRIAEEHHIVFRSQASYMVNVEINKKPLCLEHHRGNNSPHMDKKIDVKYKLELQNKLFKIFPKSFYTENEIQEVLNISETETRAIVKTMRRYKEGFERLDIVIRCMGGKLYVK
jgi:hypothetical protein